VARRSSRSLTAGVAALAVLVLAGCGATTGAATPAPAAPTSAPTTPGTTTPGTATPGTTPGTATPGTATPGTTPGTTTPGTTTPGTTPPSTVPALTDRAPGAALLHTVLADATAQQWVHGTSTSPAERGAAATSFVSDDGPDRGTQDITVGSLSGAIRVLGDRTYIQGSPESLEALFEVPADIAAPLGGVWITLQPGDSEYHSITIGVTSPSFLQEIAFTGAVTKGTATVAGAAVTVLEGTLAASAGPGTGVLYLTGAAQPLPLTWVEVGSTGTTRTSFADWGHAVTVSAPSGAVPLPTAPGGVVTMAALRG
jgi:hypothetical protein